MTNGRTTFGTIQLFIRNDPGDSLVHLIRFDEFRTLAFPSRFYHKAEKNQCVFFGNFERLE